jgi:hypothetical protein
VRRIATTELDGLLTPLMGLTAWQCELGVGSMFTVEFGEPWTDVDGAVRGRWHLWVTMAAWRLETGDRVLAGCEDHRSRLAEVLPALNGRRLAGISVDPVTFETVFDFSTTRLVTFPHFTVPAETVSLGEWLLWTPDGMVVTADPARGLSLTRGSGEPPAQNASCETV